MPRVWAVLPVTNCDLERSVYRPLPPDGLNRLSCLLLDREILHLLLALKPSTSILVDLHTPVKHALLILLQLVN